MECRSPKLRLAVYAHYSESGGLALYVLHFLKQLRDSGFRICFVSNSPIPQSSLQELHRQCERVIQRENTGYDFAMWRRALEEYSLGDFEELLLVNSSIVGPFYPLQPLWQRAATIACDFWGMTDNSEFAHHLQSYFLLFRRQVLQHPCFMTFWHSVLPFGDKQTAIVHYEIGLTQWLEENGFKRISLFPQKDIHALFLSRFTLVERLKNRICPVWVPPNTAEFLPDLLLERGMPFLKVGPLRCDGKMHDRLDSALRALKTSSVPAEVLNELRR